ncbi:WSCD family member [Biomphalaria glabrata]
MRISRSSRHLSDIVISYTASDKYIDTADTGRLIGLTHSTLGLMSVDQGDLGLVSFLNNLHLTQLCSRAQLVRRLLAPLSRWRLLTLLTLGLLGVTTIVVLSHKALSCKALFPSCGPVSFSSSNLLPTALASFPGSGNTWLRSLLQDSTGLLTGSEYFDAELFEAGFPGEGIKPSTPVNGSRVLLVKTHGSDVGTMSRYNSAILLIRNPMDAILSEFNRVYGGGHLNLAPTIYIKEKWSEFVHLHTKAWMRFNMDWLKFPGNLLTVTYIDLLQRPDVEVERILRFLKMNTTKTQLACALCLGGKFKRSRSTVIEQTFPSFLQDVVTSADELYKNIVRKTAS